MLKTTPHIRPAPAPRDPTRLVEPDSWTGATLRAVAQACSLGTWPLCSPIPLSRNGTPGRDENRTA